MTAYIGYNNYLEAAGATVTSGNSVGVADSSSDTAAGQHENAFDWNTHDFWIPNLIGSYSLKIDLGSGNDSQPDYIALAAHNLGDDATAYMYLYSSDIDATIWTDNPATGWATEWTNSGSAPTSNRPHLWKFTTADNDTRRYWLIGFQTTSVTMKIACLSLGNLLTLPNPPAVGFSPAHWRQTETTFNSITDKGAFIGRQVVREGYSGTIPIIFATRSWMDSNWQNLVDHALTKPFWFVYDYENQPDEVVFCWVQGNQSWPRYQTHNLFSAALNVHAVF